MNGDTPTDAAETPADTPPEAPPSETAPPEGPADTPTETPPEAPPEPPSLSEQFAHSVNALNTSIASLRTKEANREHTQTGIAEADRAIEIAQEGKDTAVAADAEAETAITTAKSDGRVAVRDAQGVLQQIGDTIFS